MKILRLLLISAAFYFGSLFCQPDYPEINYSELHLFSYEIIYETEGYFLVKIDGVTYIVYY